jgi:hypothetical protein
VPETADATQETSQACADGGSQRRTADPPSKLSFSGFSTRKQDLGEKLVNAGVWPRRVKECLKRYSASRIEANFQLWRQRKNDPEAPSIANDGAFLCKAITDGYACVRRESGQELPENEPDSNSENGPGQQGSSALPKPTHKQKVSPQEKTRLIEAHSGVDPEHFHRYRHGEAPSEKQFLYLDPRQGGVSTKFSSGTVRMSPGENIKA